MKSICIAVIAILFSSSTKNDKLTGTWQRVIPGGDVVYRITFTADNTFEGYVNEKPFVSGTYTLRDSIFAIEDFGCPDIPGTYKVNFFGNDDSCRLQVINDACDGRLAQADNAILYRIK